MFSRKLHLQALLGFSGMRGRDEFNRFWSNWIDFDTLHRLRILSQVRHDVDSGPTRSGLLGGGWAAGQLARPDSKPDGWPRGQLDSWPVGQPDSLPGGRLDGWAPGGRRRVGRAASNSELQKRN